MDTGCRGPEQTYWTQLRVRECSLFTFRLSTSKKTPFLLQKLNCQITKGKLIPMMQCGEMLV